MSNIEPHPVSEPLQKSAQATNMMHGAVKDGEKRYPRPPKGRHPAAPTAQSPRLFVENRKTVGKVIIAATAVMIHPILLICMLPSVTFEVWETPTPERSECADSKQQYCDHSQSYRYISLQSVLILSEGMAPTLPSEIDADFTNSGADGRGDYKSYESSPNFNANLFTRSILRRKK